AMWSLPKQTVNTVITGMRLKKLAYLEIIPGTRNHKIVRLTEEGKRRGEEIVAPVTCAEQKAFAKMPREELSLLEHLFGKYIDTLRGELHEA
ncbi:MAG: MarR family transcriptional regulator, partial [Clostridia bacterium]|nr:MarR family transcriptional regulator [Clostridia bacterium]